MRWRTAHRIRSKFLVQGPADSPFPQLALALGQPSPHNTHTSWNQHLCPTVTSGLPASSKAMHTHPSSRPLTRLGASTSELFHPQLGPDRTSTAGQGTGGQGCLSSSTNVCFLLKCVLFGVLRVVVRGLTPQYVNWWQGPWAKVSPAMCTHRTPDPTDTATQPSPTARRLTLRSKAHRVLLRGPWASRPQDHSSAFTQAHSASVNSML